MKTEVEEDGEAAEVKKEEKEGEEGRWGWDVKLF